MCPLKVFDNGYGGAPRAVNSMMVTAVHATAVEFGRGVISAHLDMSREAALTTRLPCAWAAAAQPLVLDLSARAVCTQAHL